MGLTAIAVDRLKKHCPELKQLPLGWTVNVNPDSEMRISFVKEHTGETSYNHPTLGGLPRPWILRLVRTLEGGLYPMYYDRDTRSQTTKDPRYMAKTLALHSDHAPKDLWIAARTTKNTNIDLNTLIRTPIERKKNIRDKYEIVHAIDPGDGSLGGMNGGVFVVRMKGLATRLFIEKRFKPEDVEFGKKEIEMLERVKHPALTFYSAAFILEDAYPLSASLYVEFCDRGSLEELNRAFINRSISSYPKPEVPEAFVWHALTGLCDGLAYLQSGVSLWRKPDSKPDPHWMPILHRDLKPDNVLLRSRTTLGSDKYFYCVLSDFGLACEDREDWHLLADRYQKAKVKLGTKAFWAPELCYNPYPRSYPGPQGDDEWKMFPDPYRHSRFSDVWALGATIYNLCVPDGSRGGMNHLDFRYKPFSMTSDKYLEGTRCRLHELTIPSNYTRQLRDAILLATRWDPRDRPDAVKLIRDLEPLIDSSGFAEQGAKGKNKPLPEWATKVHEYLSQAEKMYPNSGGPST